MIVILILITIFISVLMLSISTNNMYCAFYCRKERKLWKSFINKADSFRYVYGNFFGIIFLTEDEEYEAIIWKSDNTCCIYKRSNDTLICSSFDKKMSDRMVNKLMNNLNNGTEN